MAYAAGFPAKDAQIIAHASQYVDDATEEAPFLVKKPQGHQEAHGDYEDFGYVVTVRTAHCGFKCHDPITQKYVYLPFHFVPDHRPGGRVNFRVAPNGVLARKLFIQAVKERDHRLRLCRMGVALHALADTWAHQDFCGWWSRVNSVEGIRLGNFYNSYFRRAWWSFLLFWKNLYLDFLPSVGHAEAGHFPDLPWAHYHYSRTFDRKEKRRDNPSEFCEAAEEIYKLLCWAVRRIRRNSPEKSLAYSTAPETWERLGKTVEEVLLGCKSQDKKKRCRYWRENLKKFLPDLKQEIICYDKLAWRKEALKPLSGAPKSEKASTKKEKPFPDWDRAQRRAHGKRYFKRIYDMFSKNVAKPHFQAKENFENSWWLTFHRAALMQQQYVMHQLVGHSPANLYK